MTGLQDDKRPDHLIVGGGVAGCTLAYELARRGRRVLLLEAGRIGGQGASSVPAALLNPYRGRSARAGELDRAGLAAVRRLAGELGGLGTEPGIHLTGVLRIASNRKQAKTWRRREGMRWLEADEVPGSYHAPFGGFLVEEGGWLEPEKLLGALVTAAGQCGATILEGCRVEGLEAQGKGVKIRSAQGPFEAKTVILCTGATTGPGFGLPALEHVAGEVVGLASGVAMPYPIAGAVYGAQTGERVYIGGNHRPADRDDPGAPAQLQQAAGWFVRALRDAERVSVWTGVRARTDNNEPLVTELQAGVWFLGALAGRGFLCSAHLAETLADRLCALGADR